MSVKIICVAGSPELHEDRPDHGALRAQPGIESLLVPPANYDEKMSDLFFRGGHSPPDMNLEVAAAATPSDR